jgi:hypothetical protein
VTEWLTWLRNPTVFIGVSLGMGLLSLASLVGLPFLLVRIPPDYFLSSAASVFGDRRRFLERIVKNFLGATLLVLGVVMLVLPGQGLLTIFVALVLLDFPRKRRLELWLIRRPRVLASVNSLRLRFGRLPLKIDNHG